MIADREHDDEQEEGWGAQVIWPQDQVDQHEGTELEEE